MREKEAWMQNWDGDGPKAKTSMPSERGPIARLRPPTIGLRLFLRVHIPVDRRMRRVVLRASDWLG
jgi:hypothetical protein